MLQVRKNPHKKTSDEPVSSPVGVHPDGEPHIFGDRIYLFGSHDTEGGDRYCSKGDYVGWSAQLDDLSDWRYKGVMYSAEQDPHTRPGVTDLYAPDVVQGKDDRYYLYYTLPAQRRSI